MSVKTKKDCNPLLEDFMWKAIAIQALRAETTEERIKNLQAQGVLDRTWSIPFRSVREELRDKVADTNKVVDANEAQLKKMRQELTNMAAQLEGCRFTKIAQRSWSLFSSNS